MPRRVLLAAFGLFTAACVSVAFAADNSKDSSPVLQFDQFKTKSLEGKDVDLSQYKGKVLLVVNVASKCGFTPQYKDLEALHDKYAKEGLAVLAFPCNQFLHQEPGTPEQIRHFCTSKYNVAFDVFNKIDVNGDSQDPLYKWLTSRTATPSDPGPVRWNFEKFLIGRDGKVIARYRSRVKPASPQVVEAIETALKSK